MEHKFKTVKLLKDLLPLLWVKQEKIRGLFLLSFFLIFLTIGFNLSVPIILKIIVLQLSLANGSMSNHLFLLLIASGLIWTLSHCIQQIRQIIMVRPLESSLRLFSSNFFDHLHSLPISSEDWFYHECYRESPKWFAGKTTLAVFAPLATSS